jgi:exonuclease SbcC
MRPLELRVRNFRSYSGEHTFSFRDRTLVGIVGPIGSGKSSILDAIAFALYGRTPRIGSATKTLINQRAAAAGVVLRFVVEDEIWEAARSIRVKGPSKHALYRYDSDEPDVEPVEKLLMEGDVNSRIVELLGLDFSAFERSVLLAQGRFAEFLQSRPSDRDKVLKGVFGHDKIDRMKALAKARRDEAVVAADKLSIRLERFDEIKASLVTNRTQLKEAERRRKTLAKAQQRLRLLDESIGEAKAGIAAARKRLTGLEDYADRLPDPTSTARLLDEAAAAEKRRTDLAASLDESQQHLNRAEKRFARANESGEPELIQRAIKLLASADPQLKAVVAADRRIASSVERLESARISIDAANKGLAEANESRDHSLGRAVEAAKIREEAEAALEKGRHADMAATLRATLATDEPCPVCSQPVHELPEVAGNTHIEELEAVVSSARRTKKEVDKNHTAALGLVERAKEQLKAALDKQEAATAQLAGSREDAVRVRGDLEETTLQLEKILGSGDAADHLDKRRAAYDGLIAERDDAQRKTDQVRGLHDQSIRDEQEAAKALQNLGVRLAELATRLETNIVVGDDARGLGEAFGHLRDRWAQLTSELHEETDRWQTALDKSEAEKRQLLSDLEVADDLASAVAVLVDRIDRLETAVARDDEEVAQADALYEEQAKQKDLIGLFGRINQDLTDSRFVRFLLDEERSRLAGLGSEHFQQLSGGRYRFADDQFAIMDLTAADSVRRADSLSGGETFLASLGLALALAEMVAGTGGRLDAFFLDEGFGTLDPEHLDLAMEGIERLIAGDTDRLVVVVSHVPELRMRFEDLIELERSPATGDTKVLRQ